VKVSLTACKKAQKGWLDRARRCLRLHYLRLLRERSTARKSGLGFALGVFIGIFPSFAIGSPLAFYLASRLEWNRSAALAGTFVMNPFTAPFFYWISTWLGLRILHESIPIIHIENALLALREFGGAFLLGIAIVALAFAVLIGLGVYFWLRKTYPSGRCARLFDLFPKTSYARVPAVRSYDGLSAGRRVSAK
jgi:uncharacterized protein (DUF2062 family)